MKDLLTPRERFGLLVIDEPHDRVPLFPLLTAHAAMVCRVPLRDYYTDGEVMAKCQLHSREFYQTDFISFFSEVGIVAEALGSEFVYPEEDLPVLSRPRWQDLLGAAQEIGMLPPEEPERRIAEQGRLKVYLDGIRYAYEATADTVPLLAYIPAPFTTAQQLIEPDAFLLGLLEHPAAVQTVLQYATRAVRYFSWQVIRAGALPILVDPLASGSVLSPQHYQEFALPGEREIIRFWHRYDLDVVLHICGDTTAIVQLMPETGADLISVDRIDLNYAIAQVGDRVRVIGNFDTSSLWLDSPETITPEVAAMVEHGKRCPRGYVAATGCEVPLRTPPENLKAFLAAARETGGYHFPLKKPPGKEKQC